MTKIEIGEQLINEKKFIESLVSDYIKSHDSSQARFMRDLALRTFKPYVKEGGVALQLGCEVGYNSELISKIVGHLDIVDGAQEFLEHVKKRNIKNASYYCSLFEEFCPDKKYDYIFASHVLEHLISVSDVLEVVKKALKPDGLLFVTVPNACAASRQLARHMGLIEDLYELTPNDIRGGHRRVYDYVTLSRDIEYSGFEIISQGGILFKPFADFQMDKLIEIGVLGKEQLDGLYSLGFEYPDLCADIFLVAHLKKETTT